MVHDNGRDFNGAINIYTILPVFKIKLIYNLVTNIALDYIYHTPSSMITLLIRVEQANYLEIWNLNSTNNM